MKVKKSKENANVNFCCCFPYFHADFDQINFPLELLQNIIVNIPVTGTKPLKPKELAEYTLLNRGIFRHNLVYIPPKLRQAVPNKLLTGHFGIVKCKPFYWALDAYTHCIISRMRVSQLNYILINGSVPIASGSIYISTLVL